MMLSNQVYGVLKASATIVLPGVSTLYFTLAQIWGFPKAEETVGTIAAINVFLGVLIGLSTKAYNKSDAKYSGAIDVEEQEDGTKVYSLGLNGDPYEIDKKQEILFKVNGN
jgi:hypothetical protein